MSEKLYQVVINIADDLIGPTLDWFGTTTKPMSLTAYNRVDKQTNEVIGEGRQIAGDGLVYMDSFNQRSALRNQVFGKK